MQPTNEQEFCCLFVDCILIWSILKQFHRLGLSSGGTDEGAPGLREEGSDVSYAYIRDLDGNKICAFYSGAEKLSAHE